MSMDSATFTGIIEWATPIMLTLVLTRWAIAAIKGAAT